MVRRARLLLLALLPVLAGHAAAAELSLQPDQDTSEYGRPLYATLRTTVPQPRLDSVNLVPLDTDFIVQRIASMEQDGINQRWRLRLYPRRSGDLAIPSLQLGPLRSAPVPVRITPAVDPGSGRPVNVEFHVGQTAVWLKQPLRVSVQLTTDNRYAALEHEDPPRDGIDVQPVPLTESDKPSADGTTLRSLHTGWTLVSHTTGHRSIQLPAVVYRHDGVITHRFFPPTIDLDVRPLPTYLPVTTPVGDISVETRLEGPVYVKNNISFITLRLRGDGNVDQHVAKILGQLNSSNDIRMYPPQPEAAAGEPGATIYRVPFTPLASGLLQLPTLRLQYFDPETGTLRTRNVTLGAALALSLWLLWSAAILALVVLVIALRYALRRLNRLLHRHRGYRDALRQLRAASTPQDLRAAFTAIAHAENWSANLTLAQWSQHWETCCAHLPAALEQVTRLQESLYGRRPANLEELRRTMVRTCNQRALLLRALGI